MFGVCLFCLPSTASVIYSSLGSGNDVYNSNGGFGFGGSACPYCNGVSEVDGMGFTAGGIGVWEVTNLALGMFNDTSPNTFDVSIYSSNGSGPGTPVPGATWDSLSTNVVQSECCSLVTVSGITGVELTGGDNYYLVLSPVSLSDGSFNVLAYSTTGANQDYQYSNNGGSTWNDTAVELGGAFEIDGSAATPEPATLALIGTGLIGLLAVRRRTTNR
jgi:hypothetical protein